MNDAAGDRPLAFAIRSAGFAAVFAVLGYGWLYFSYKYYSPWFGGGGDFASYYRMILSPLDAAAAEAPFVHRQLGALIAHAIHATGIGYDTATAFGRTPAPDGAGGDARVFFAAVVSNWLALVGASALIAAHVAQGLRDLGIWRLAIGGLAGLLVWAGFGVQQHVLTGLMEGWGWFLVTLGLIAMLRGWPAVLTLACAGLVVQRETGLVVLALFAGLGLVAGGRRGFAVYGLVCSIGALCVYLSLRLWFVPVAGHAHQLAPAGMGAALAAAWPPTPDLLMQGFAIHNLFWLLLGLSVLAWLRYGRGLFEDAEWRTLFMASVLAFVALALIGLAAGIGNNVGRIIAIATPLWVLCLAAGMRRIGEIDLRGG